MGRTTKLMAAALLAWEGFRIALIIFLFGFQTPPEMLCVSASWIGLIVMFYYGAIGKDRAASITGYSAVAGGVLGSLLIPTGRSVIDKLIAFVPNLLILVIVLISTAKRNRVAQTNTSQI